MSKKHQGKVTVITTPSRFGSHKNMVVKELDEEKVLCEDDSGEYETYKNRLDTGMSDPLRCFGR